MKILKKVLLLLLLMTLGISLIACGGGGGGDTPCEVCVDENGDGKCDECKKDMPKSEINDVQLIVDGEPNFQFVLAKDVSVDIRRTVQSDIVAVIKRNFDIEIENIVEDSSSDEETEIEVIVGGVKNRGEDYYIDGHTLGKNGYVIKIVGKKIIINAGSDEKLIEALGEFAEDILGYEEDEMLNVTMKADDIVDKPQTNYKITSLKIGGEDARGFTIATDLNDSIYYAAATNLQNMLYDRAGIWLEVVPLSEAEKSISFISIPKVYGEESFKVSVKNGGLVFECAFDNKFEDAVSAFITQKITLATGDINFEGTVFTRDISVVYYEDFGAKGDGTTNDYQAIYDTHVFANECGQTVKAKENAKYYLHESAVIIGNETNAKVRAIPVMTNVDWTGAEFIIDDSDLSAFDSATKDMAYTNIFEVVSEYEKLTFDISDTKYASKLEALGSIGHTYGTDTIDLGLGYPALLVIYNSDKMIYRRYGSDYANRNGGKGQYSEQKEIIKVDENGKISDETPFMFDYDMITKIEIIRTDIEPITIKGGLMSTIACGVDAEYTDSTGATKTAGYYARGIKVSRSFTVVDGVKHFITGEVTLEQQRAGIQGPHYSGFFVASEADTVTFKNCVLQGRRYYSLSGTYDFSASLVNNITLLNCKQRNFWVDDNGNPSETDTGRLSMERVDVNGKTPNYCWGIGGTNFCKNMLYQGCTLSRFDAHQGLYNGSLIDSTICAFEIIGKGDFIIKNVNWYTYADQSSTSSNVIALRSDYGSTWEGDILIDGFNLYVVGESITLIPISYNNWDFGYTCYAPSVEIKDMKIFYKTTRQPVSSDFKVYLYSTNLTKDPYVHLDNTKSTPPKEIIWDEAKGEYVFATVYDRGFENDNPTVPPAYVKIVNNEAGYRFIAPASDDANFFFAKTKFYYTETEFYEGTNHEDTQVFDFK